MTTNDQTAELLAKVNQVIEAGTFSLQAAESIAKLREENATLKAKVTALEASCAATLNEKRLADAEVQRLRANESQLDARKKVVEEREAKLHEQERLAAVANARADTYKECVGLVFRNAEVRREVFASEQATGGNSYPGQTVSTSRMITEKQE